MSGTGRMPGLADRLAGAVAFVGMVGVLVAVPVGLVWAVGWPLPHSAPSPDAIVAALRYGQVAASTLVRLIATALWVTWAATVVSIGVEIVAVARGTVARAIPGLGALQHAAGRLVATVMLIASVTSRAGADAPPLPSTASPPVPAVLAPVAPTVPGTPADANDHARPQHAESATPTWTVRRRDSLWTIAERTLGDGHRWREIADLNIGRRQPDGLRLGSDCTLIRPGWRLELPPDAEVDRSPDQVTVARGDDLWSIAEEHLGDGERWPEIHARNRGRPQPDGGRLHDPDVLRPGWTLQLPTAENAATDTAGGARRARPPSRHERPASPGARADEPRRGRDADRARGSAADGVDGVSPVVERPPRPVPGGAANGARPSAPDQPAAPTPADVRPPRPVPGDATRGAEARDGEADQRAPRSPAVERPRERSAGDDVSPTRPAPVPPRPVTPQTLPQPRSHETRPASERRPVDRREDATPNARSADATAIVGGAVVAAVLIGMLQTRRRHWLRRRRYGERPAAVDPEAAELERWLRSMAEQDLRNRIDRTLRVMTDHFRAHGVAPVVRRLEIGEQTTLHVADDGPRPPAVTAGEDPLRWTLAPELDVAAPSTEAMRYVPTLVSCGRMPSGSLLHLNPLAVAGIGVVGAPDIVADVMTSWVTELASESAERGVEILVVGRHHPLVEHLPRVTIVADAPSAVDRLERTDHDERSWTVVLCDADAAGSAVGDLFAAAERPDVGAVVFGCATAETTVEVAGGRVRIRPGDLWLDAPSWLTPDDWDRFGDLLRRNGPREAPVSAVSPLLAAVDAVGDDASAEHSVAVLGPLTVDGRTPDIDDDAAAALTYLAVHRTGADPATLRRILWPREDVEDSRLEAALGVVDRAFDAPVVVHTDDGRIELTDDVACDLGRCKRIVDGLDHLAPSEQARRLYTALRLVRGEPFAGTVAWAHADGTALETASLVVDLAHRLAMHALTIGDADRATWAIDRGLQAGPASELLHRDRMRVADAQGDMAAVDCAMRQAQRLAEADGGWVSVETEECYRTLTGRDAPPGESRDAS